jgi:hypothetical protein
MERGESQKPEHRINRIYELQTPKPLGKGIVLPATHNASKTH